MDTFKSVSARLQEHVMQLEGGKRTSLLSSGTIAVFQTIMTLARAGDEIVVSANVRPEIYNLFQVLLRDSGISINFVNSTKARDYTAAISLRTRFIFLDAEGGQIPQAFELSDIAYIAHKNKIPLVVDAGSIAPYTFKPAQHGADIVIRDLALLCGTDVCTGGAVTEAGTFDWRTSNVPLIKGADPCCNGIRWAFDLPAEEAAVAFSLRLEHVQNRILSTSLPEPNAFYILDNIDAVALRFERKCANAKAIATLLEKSDAVAWVAYPPLTDNSPAEKAYGKHFCSAVAFAFKGTTEESQGKARAFLDALQTITPAGLTHSKRSVVYAPFAQKTDSPVIYTAPPFLPHYENAIRFIAGIEETASLRADIAHALKKV